MVGIIIYFLLATMTGIVNIGVRFLWVTLYRIKRASTAPQGLLFSSILLSFGLLAFNYSIISVVAPGYAHYGSQVYVSRTFSLFMAFNMYIFSVIIPKEEEETVVFKLIKYFHVIFTHQ